MEGGLGAERGPVGGSCECLVRGEGSQEGRAVVVGPGWWRQGGWSQGREGASWREL